MVKSNGKTGMKKTTMKILLFVINLMTLSLLDGIKIDNISKYTRQKIKNAQEQTITLETVS